MQRVTELGWTMRQAATAAGVSARTGYKWLARYRAEGVAGLADRRVQSAAPPAPRPRAAGSGGFWGSAPGGSVGRPSPHRTGIPRATVGNVLRRHGVGRLGPREAKPPVQRYEWAVAGALVHIDTKALGRIAGIGHRIHGDRTTRVRGIGWEHVHVCIDDATRLAYVEVLATNAQHDAIAFLTRAVAWFAARGVRVQRVMSDNGSAYLARAFARACATLGLRHLRTRPYTPRTNGKAERFIQTLLREWAYVRAYPTSARRRRALRPWLRYYNHRRPHTALGYRPPITRLQQVPA